MSELHHLSGPLSGATRPPPPELADLLARPGVRAGWDRALFSDSPVPLALSTADGVLIDCNQAFCELLGHARSEFVGRSYDWFTLPPDLPPDQAEFARLAAGEIDRYSLAKRYLTKFGSIVCVDLTVQRVDGADGVFELAVAHALPAAVSPEYLRPTTTPDGRPAYRAAFSLRASLEDWFRSFGVSNRVGYTALWTAATVAVGWLATVSAGTVSGYMAQRDDLIRSKAAAETLAAKVQEISGDLKAARDLTAQQKAVTDRMDADGRQYRERMEGRVDLLLRELAGVKRTVNQLPKDGP